MKWPPGLRELVLDRDGHRCVRCGATDELHVDHVIARCHGGPTVEANLRVLCGTCNRAKRRDAGEFAPRRGAVKAPAAPVPGSFRHGTQHAYRRRRCRCPECRAWKRTDVARYATK